MSPNLSPKQNLKPNRKPTQPNRVDAGGKASTQRMPPQSLEAEMCVLGSMILDRDGIGEVIPLLREENFYREDHRLIYGALVSLYENNKPTDLVVLRDELERHKNLERVGGVEYLVRLVDSVPSAANILFYARIVRDKGMLRNLIAASSEICDLAYEQQGEVGEVLETAEQKIFEVTQQKISGHGIEIKEILNQVFTSLEQRSGKMITGIATGYQDLDRATCGLQQGEMIIVAARPSMGKTALGLNIAEYVGTDSRMPVAVFSLEMGSQQLAERMLAGRAHINSHKLRQGMLSDRENQLLMAAADELREAKIYVDDSPSLSPLELRAKARRLKLKHDIQLIVVDYLQLMHVVGAESRVQEVGLISRHLKALARELDIPVLAMAQLNRSTEGREGHRPRMSDLRESGNIEQDADVIMMLHRESYYRKKSMDGTEDSDDFQNTDDNIAEIIIEKQRNGPTGTIKLFWYPEWTRFENLSNAPEVVPVQDF